MFGTDIYVRITRNLFRVKNLMSAVEVEFSGFSPHLRGRFSIYLARSLPMCRNIRTLFNFEPPATEAEIQASALQFVRKLSGYNKPSKANEAAFNLAVEQVSEAARTLIRSLVTEMPPRDREIERARAMAVAAKRFGQTSVMK